MAPAPTTTSVREICLVLYWVLEIGPVLVSSVRERARALQVHFRPLQKHHVDQVRLIVYFSETTSSIPLDSTSTNSNIAALTPRKMGGILLEFLPAEFETYNICVAPKKGVLYVSLCPGSS